MDHEWTVPARNAAEPEVKWTANASGLWMGDELIGFPEASREMMRLNGELAELREASKAVLQGFDAAAWVRNISGDGAEDWAMKALPHLAALGKFVNLVRPEKGE